MTQAELQQVLDDHAAWVDSGGGKFANLRGANLQYANLWDADLQHANLRAAGLQYANLEGADLQYADLHYADLHYADLRDADLRGANLPHYQIPQAGELRVYKRVKNRIVHLKIPRGARRTASLVGRKCRASHAVVLAIQGDEPVESRDVIYRIGETVYPDSYDDDPRVECTHGIHFFLTRKEAEEY